MNCWKFLNIDATLDKKRIKRAYSKLLRVYHPEKDAVGFQQLKAAYDQAMHSASEMSSDDVEDYNKNDASSLVFEQDAIESITPLEVKLTTEEPAFVANEIAPYQEYKEYLRVLSENFDARFSSLNWEKLFKLFDLLDLDEKQQSINDLIIELVQHPHLDLSIYQYIENNFQMLNYFRDVISFNQLVSLTGRSALNNLLTYLKGEKIAISSVHYLPLLGLGLRVQVTDDIFFGLEKIAILNDEDRLPLQLEIINDLIRKYPQVHFLKIKRIYCLKQQAGYSEECLSVLDDLQDKPDAQLEKLIFLADMAFSEKNFNQASVFFSEALKLDLESNRLVYKLAICHMESGDFEIARPLLQDLVERAPNNILFQIKCKQCAYAILKTKSFDLNRTEDFQLKIDLQFEFKQYDAIINITDEYIDKSENIEIKKIICFYKSKIYQARCAYQDAFDYLSKSLNYARQLGENGHDEMVGVLALLDIGYASETPVSYDQEKMLLQALLLFPGQARILFLLGEFNRLDKDDPTQAVEYYSQAIEYYLKTVDTHSKIYNCYAGRGYAFYYLDKDELALKDFTAVKKKYPNNTRILKFMAMSYLNLNLNEEAVQEYLLFFELTVFENISRDDQSNYVIASYRLLSETLYLSSMTDNAAEFVDSVNYIGLGSEQREIAESCIKHAVPAIKKYCDNKKLNMQVKLSLCLFGLGRYGECQVAVEDGLKYINDSNGDILYVDNFINQFNCILIEIITKGFEFSDRKSKEVQDAVEDYFNKIFENYEKNRTNDFLIASTTAKYSNLYFHYYNDWDRAYHFSGIAIQRFNHLRETSCGVNILLYLRHMSKIYFETAQCSVEKISNEHLDQHWENAIECASSYDEKVFYFFHQCRDYSYRRKDYATAIIKINEFMAHWDSLKPPLLPCSTEILIYELAAECFLEMQKPLEAYGTDKKYFEQEIEDDLHKMYEILMKINHFLLKNRDIFNENEKDIIARHETFVEMAVLYWNKLSQGEPFEQLTTLYIENGMGENVIKLFTEHPGIDLEITSKIKMLATKPIK